MTIGIMGKKGEDTKMATKKFVLTEENAKLTKKEIKELEKAAKLPKAVDPEFPPFTAEQLAKFKRVTEIEREERLNNRKQNVTLRLSPETVRKAKSLGKGYTSILAKIIESVLDNPSITEQIIR